MNQEQKPEDKLLIARLQDKISVCKTKNKIVNIDFLDLYQKSMLEKEIKTEDVKHVFYGGYDGAERNILILYPDKLELEIIENYYKEILNVVRIELPSDLEGKYQHKSYLGAVMKLGLKREKVGDIIVSQTGADIIVEKEIAEYLKNSLEELTRFSKSKIEIIELDNLKQQENNREEFQILVPSLRLDSIVSEIIKLSRNKANEAILAGRVFVNSENILKNSKTIKEGDIITVRGKGKFEFAKIIGTTKKDRLILQILKYV